jgi:short-subunit dehydrogenase
MKMNVVVTGGSSGIGAEIRKLYEGMGHKVFSLSRSNQGDAKDYIPCDVSSEESVRAAVERIAEGGRIDVLINNAGVGLNGAAELVDSNSARACMDVNFMGTYYCIKYALPHMSKNGKIINVSSAAGIFALPFKEFYCAAKASVNMLSFGLRMELSQTGIKVSSVCPGDTQSNFNKKRMREFETNERYGSRIQEAAEKLDKRDSKRMPAAAVARKICKVAAKRNPKPLYIIGAKYKAMYFFWRILPLNLFLKLTNNLLGK